jgi:hypothetical protein
VSASKAMRVRHLTERLPLSCRADLATLTDQLASLEVKEEQGATPAAQ